MPASTLTRLNGLCFLSSIGLRIASVGLQEGSRITEAIAAYRAFQATLSAGSIFVSPSRRTPHPRAPLQLRARPPRTLPSPPNPSQLFPSSLPFPPFDTLPLSYLLLPVPTCSYLLR